jgi:Uma2 family endonuclease
MPAIKQQPGVALRRWTRSEYYQLARAGLLRGQRVELIEGEIVEMSPRKLPHSAAVSLTLDALRGVFGRGYWSRSQEPLHLGSRSEPEPDVSVVVGSVRTYKDHPTAAVIVVEVADTTLSYDRRRKGSLYAKAGIADYWIINLRTRELEVRREPRKDKTQKYGFGYKSLTVLKESDTVTPLAAPNARIAVADLLP